MKIEIGENLSGLLALIIVLAFMYFSLKLLPAIANLTIK